jgi:hypothetical protein
LPPDGADERKAALDLASSDGILEELRFTAARRAELTRSLLPEDAMVEMHRRM